jgi:nucleoid-associated protein YgaU
MLIYRFLIITAVLMIFLAGCGTTTSRWRAEAVTVLERIKNNDAAAILPHQYHVAEESVIKGDRLSLSGEKDSAERYFFLALQEAYLIEKMLPEEKARINAEKKKLQEQAGKRELDERIKGIREAQEQRKANEQNGKEKRLNAERLKQSRERALHVYHTVKRGESLPSIAALPEVYDDSQLWLLLYRANRDQIRDPKYISPGQVLRIPRNLSREDILEAVRYSREKPI